jgi:hypothetical protein
MNEALRCGPASGVHRPRRLTCWDASRTSSSNQQCDRRNPAAVSKRSSDPNKCVAKAQAVSKGRRHQSKPVADGLRPIDADRPAEGRYQRPKTGSVRWRTVDRTFLAHNRVVAVNRVILFLMMVREYLPVSRASRNATMGGLMDCLAVFTSARGVPWGRGRFHPHDL